MPSWEVRSPEGSAVVEGSNWLAAVAGAAERLGLDPAALGRIVCEIRPDGLVRVREPATGRVLLVRMLPEDPAPSPAEPEPEPVAVEPPPPPPEEPEPEPVAVEPPPPPPEVPRAEPGSQLEATAVPAARLDEPLAPALLAIGSSGAFTEEDLVALHADAEEEPAGDGPPPDLAETLFERCWDISGADGPREAARLALRILTEVVPAESSAVLYAGINHTSLEFLAATGPRAEEVVRLRVPFGRGIAGAVFDLGTSLIVEDARRDPRHLGDIDRRTGYRTGPLLATPIRDADGRIYGVIELLNPPARFLDWHLDAAATVATALADYLRGQEPSAS